MEWKIWNSPEGAWSSVATVMLPDGNGEFLFATIRRFADDARMDVTFVSSNSTDDVSFIDTIAKNAHVTAHSRSAAHAFAAFVWGLSKDPARPRAEATVCPAGSLGRHTLVLVTGGGAGFAVGSYFGAELRKAFGGRAGGMGAAE